MTNQEIAQAFRKANYFVFNEHQEVIESLLRCACGKKLGYQMSRVLIFLELTKVGSPILTPKRKDYLYENFKMK